MTDAHLIGQLIANSHIAQIIHKRGLLIFANMAAARVFGFATIAEFQKFAKTTTLLENDKLLSLKPEKRIFLFQRGNNIQKSVEVTERRVNWHGSSATYLELMSVSKTAVSIDPLATVSDLYDDETYFLDTISSAIDLSRGENEPEKPLHLPFDYAAVCFKFCDELTAFAQQRSVSLNIEVTPRAQQIFQGDALKLARAGSSILRHAIQRAAGGRVDVTLRADEKGEHVMLEVCDDGMSYTPEDANTLFEAPTQRSENSRQSVDNKVMNLPLARCIARSIGGEVGLKVNHASGGMVRMRLPFSEFAPATSDRTCFNPKQRTLDILVVEDNPTSQHVIKTILDALGHRVTIAENGQMCMEIMSQVIFDIVFMDLHMPIKDGYATTQAIRARESRTATYVPILAITADRRPETRAKAIGVGITGFLSKPVYIPQIMTALSPYMMDAAQPTTAIEKSAMR